MKTMMRSLRSFGHRQDGNALVEFALLVPFMILLVAGIIEIGRFAYFNIIVANAARAGAQYGAQSGATAIDDSGMIAAAVNDGNNNGVGSIASPAPTATQFCSYWNTATQTLSSNSSCAQTTGTQVLVRYVAVTVNGQASTLFRYPFIPHTITLSSTATMRVKN